MVNLITFKNFCIIKNSNQKLRIFISFINKKYKKYIVSIYGLLNQLQKAINLRHFYCFYYFHTYYALFVVCTHIWPHISIQMSPIEPSGDLPFE